MQLATIMFALASAVFATEAATPAPRVGEAFQIDTDREMEEHGSRSKSEAVTLACRSAQTFCWLSRTV